MAVWLLTTAQSTVGRSRPISSGRESSFIDCSRMRKATTLGLRRRVGLVGLNEQLLFHMVFGYMVVQRLLVLVRVFSRLPDAVSRVFARTSTPQSHRSMSSTITAPARPPWSTTATGWAQRWIG